MNNYIETFTNTMMKDFPFGTYGDSETIKSAVSKAYVDFQPRTVKGHGDFDNPKGRTVEWLSSRLSEYFKKPKKTQEIYNSWHQKVCSDFVQFYNVTFSADIKFGKAQKLLNMAMKYLFCAWGEEHKDAFVFCHMPIDAYILDWYRKEINASQKTTWSNLDCNEYYEIAEKINAHKLEEIPIIAEFEIWQKEKEIRKKKDAISSLKRTISYLEEELPELADEANYLNQLLDKMEK